MNKLVTIQAALFRLRADDMVYLLAEDEIRDVLEGAECLLAAVKAAAKVMDADDEFRELLLKQDRAQDYTERVVLKRLVDEQAYKLATYKNALRGILAPLLADARG